MALPSWMGNLPGAPKPQAPQAQLRREGSQIPKMPPTGMVGNPVTGIGKSMVGAWQEFGLSEALAKAIITAVGTAVGFTIAALIVRKFFGAEPFFGPGK